MNSWPRLEGETDKQYIFRVCSNKELIGTWNDVADILNETLGVQRDECCYRKAWKSFQQLQGASEVNLSDAQEVLEAIREERRELEKAKVKFRDERNEVSRLLRVQARGESMRELIERCIKSYEPDDGWGHIDCVEGDDLYEVIVHLTDVHAGAGIDNSFNQYDKNIMRDRLHQYCKEIAEASYMYGHSKCYLVLGGDLVNGAIHVNSRLENNEHVINQVISVSECIAEFVAEVSRFFAEGHVYSVPGNHSRLFPAKEDNQYGEYLDKLVSYIVAAKCANMENIKFHENTIEDSIASFTVMGNLVYAVHGDKDTVGNVVQNLTMMTGKKPQIVLMGHRHTNGLTTVYDTKVYESGCVSGPDTYCMDKRLRNKPEQTILVVGEKGVKCAYDVKLD